MNVRMPSSTLPIAVWVCSISFCSALYSSLVFTESICSRYLEILLSSVKTSLSSFLRVAWLVFDFSCAAVSCSSGSTQLVVEGFGDNRKKVDLGFQLLDIQVNSLESYQAFQIGVHLVTFMGPAGLEPTTARL